MTSREGAASALAALVGQWIEAVDAEPGRHRLVASRGWIVQGAIRVPALGERLPRRDDARLIGQVIARAEVRADGALALAMAFEDGSSPLEVAIAPPWDAAALRGAGVAAASPEAIAVRPAGAPIIATDAAMRAWAAAPVDELDLDLLRRAEDDWLSPADVASALAERGVFGAGALCEQGVDRLARCIARGDLRVGSLAAGGFVPSQDAPDEVIELVGAMWGALSDRHVLPGQISWFEITEAGSARLAG